MLDKRPNPGSPDSDLGAQRRKSAVRKIIAVNPTRLGIPSARHPAPSNVGKGLAAGFVAILWVLGIIAAVLTALFLVAALIIGGAVYYFASTLPPATKLASIHVDQSTRIYDRNGALLFEVFDPNTGRRTVIPPNQIPKVMKEATIATEDPNFYTNPGVDVEGVTRAVYYLVTTRHVMTGGSTITQQLVKTMLLTPEETLDRKVREAFLSLEVSQHYSKDEIMAMYLNMIYYGNLSYGIQAASQSYFKKDAIDMDVAESSLLAGLPQQPSLYDPCSNPDLALARQKIVLGLMVKNKFITDRQASDASDEMSSRIKDPAFQNNCYVKVNTVAPHFVDYVTKVLEQTYGPDVVYKGGLQVYTTLDPAVQKITQEEAQKQISQLKAQNVSNAAVVVENPRTGEILAMLGSVDYFNKSIDGQVNVADSLRQPGSSIKPFNYVTAFEQGWSPATPILDTKTVFNMGQGFPPYVPANYDRKYHGIVNVRMALANSLNIPAVRTLYFVTVPRLIASARTFGFTSFTDPTRYGLSMTLGGAEVRLVEHTGAYEVFANGGMHVPITPFRKIVDGQGHVLVDIENNPPAPTKVIDPRYAYQITSILSDNQARTLEFGPNSPLKLNRPAAAKTGTTDDFRDNWTMGYTPELVVGVWVGNSDNKPMINSTGITGAAPIWHNVMQRIYSEIAPYKTIAAHDFTVPPGLVQAVVCKQSGLLAGNSCPPGQRYTEIFLAEQAPTTSDRFWNGGWGGTCIQYAAGSPVSISPAGTAYYDQLVKQAEAKGMPQGMAGLGNCGPSPTAGGQPPVNYQDGGGGGGGGGGPPRPPPGPPPKKKKH